jgi:hypothetical protein
MTRRRHASLVVLLSIAAPAVFAALATGCADNPVGRKCDLGTATPGVNDVVVASPSLDCVSRTCLKVPQGCDAKNAENTCCNLAGRRGNPLYASCKN